MVPFKKPNIRIVAAFGLVSGGYGMGIPASLAQENVLMTPCRGVMLRDESIAPYGDDGATYHLKTGQVVENIRPQAGKNGMPTYYMARDIGPIPAQSLKLLNCRAVPRLAQGLRDPGHDLRPTTSERR